MFREYPAVIRAEGQEVGLAVALQMRELPSIKSLWHNSR